MEPTIFIEDCVDSTFVIYERVLPEFTEPNEIIRETPVFATDNINEALAMMSELESKNLSDSIFYKLDCY